MITKVTVLGHDDYEHINITNQLLAKEAVKRGMEVTFLPSGKDSTGVLLIDTKSGDGIITLKSSVINATTGYGVIIARNKFLSGQLLEQFGLPTPATILATDDQSAFEFLKKYKKIVVKPLETNHGTGITVGVTDETQLIHAIDLARTYGKTVLLQQMVEGTDHRILVVGGKVVAAARRTPAAVVGDGQSTIQQLIVKENENPLRGSGHSKPLTHIKEEAARKHLAKSRRLLEDVPAHGEYVELAGAANLSMGGSAEDITDKVHPKIKAFAVAAAERCGLGVSGVDIMSTDITKDPDEVPAYIIELNEAPGLRMHHHPSSGEARNVASEILDYVIEHHRKVRK